MKKLAYSFNWPGSYNCLEKSSEKLQRDKIKQETGETFEVASQEQDGSPRSGGHSQTAAPDWTPEHQLVASLVLWTFPWHNLEKFTIWRMTAFWAMRCSGFTEVILSSSSLRLLWPRTDLPGVLRYTATRTTRSLCKVGCRGFSIGALREDIYRGKWPSTQWFEEVCTGEEQGRPLALHGRKGGRGSKAHRLHTACAGLCKTSAWQQQWKLGSIWLQGSTFAFSQELQNLHFTVCYYQHKQNCMLVLFWCSKGACHKLVCLRTHRKFSLSRFLAIVGKPLELTNQP